MHNSCITIEDKNGRTFTIDSEDGGRVDKYTWTVDKSGYVKTYMEKSRRDPTYTGKRERKVLYLHRLVTNASQGEVIDHINRRTTDNLKSNLRSVSKSLNALNSDASKGESGYRGVTVKKRNGKPFFTRIQINGKVKHLGSFDDPAEAHRVYLKAREEIADVRNRI